MSGEIVQSRPNPLQELGWTREQVEVIANTVAKGATTHELYAFLYLCKAYGLDPFKHEAYFMKDAKTGRWSVIVGIDGLRKLARRDPSYVGPAQAFAVREGDEFAIDAANHTVIHKLGKQRGKVIGAWARVDARERVPVVVWVDLEEYFRPGWDTWTRMPATMIAKVAEAQALRRQFGFGDVYTEEEMGVSISGKPHVVPEVAEEGIPTVSSSEQGGAAGGASVDPPAEDAVLPKPIEAGATQETPEHVVETCEVGQKVEGPAGEPEKGATTASAGIEQVLLPGTEAFFRVLGPYEVREFNSKKGQPERFCIIPAEAVRPPVEGELRLYYRGDRVAGGISRGARILARVEQVKPDVEGPKVLVSGVKVVLAPHQEVRKYA
ncbi:MAG: phage recombination protein Bet [Bacillota bacterium]